MTHPIIFPEMGSISFLNSYLSINHESIPSFCYKFPCRSKRSIQINIRISSIKLKTKFTHNDGMPKIVTFHGKPPQPFTKKGDVSFE
ncbi:hypothetical protein LguiA_036133 [Lonicera macranthoides]